MIAIPGVTTKGFEITASGQLQPGWQIHAGYTYSQSRDRDNKAIASDQPEKLFKLATTYRLPGAWHQLMVGANLHWQNNTYYESYISSSVGNARFNQGSYAVAGLVATYDVSKQIKLSLQINNLFDRHYYSSIGQRSSVYWGAPRNAQATLKYSF
jgi:outer membrane receptor for ferric coprogen and ferric-rhodotorulic acid